MSTVRVLVVDDSALMRKMISQILSKDASIEVVATAMDGVFALKKIADMRPDVITLDINMPRMDGIQTLKHIMENFSIPTIMVSSFTKKDAELTIQALELGAFDFVTKPEESISLRINDIAAELIAKVRAAAENPVVRRKMKRISQALPRVRVEKQVLPPRDPSEKILAIGVSTGGPNALSYMLPQIPADFPAPVVIVQHMPQGFTEMFARRLDDMCGLEVKEAEDGDLVLPGRVLIAPGDRHIKVKRVPHGTIAMLSSSPLVNGHRPSADVLFHSVALEYGAAATGLIMTGMGADGAEGIGEIRRKGGATFAQDEKSSVVFGMPKAAIERGYIERILPLEDMAVCLVTHFSGKESEYGTVGCET